MYNLPSKFHPETDIHFFLVKFCQMESHFSSNNEVTDPRLGGSFTSEGMKELVGLTLQCVSTSARRRPKMRLIAAELDRILEKEMSLTTVMGDGTAIVTLGSQLFTS
jgi:hypothetical protein